MASPDDRLLLLRSLVLGACGVGQVGCGGIAVFDDGQGGAGTTASTGRASTAITTQTSTSSGPVCPTTAPGAIPACLDTAGACPEASPSLAEALAAQLEAKTPCEEPEFCSCDWTVTAVLCREPGNACCYAVLAEEHMFCEGLPFVIGGASRVATLAPGNGWSAPEGSPDLEGRIDTAGLSVDERLGLADAYRRDALAEHASIASFSRLILSLLHFGAPAGLVSEAQRALADEVRHARVCLAIAEAYDGRREAPGPLDVGGALVGRLDVATFVGAVVREGCVEETIAALRAARACDAAVDPTLHHALARIADDEARHAALSHRIVAFMITTYGAPAREAAARVFARVFADLVAVEVADARDARTVRDALDQLVRPAAALLLAARAPASARPGVTI